MMLESVVCSVGDGKAVSIPDALPATSSKRCPQEYFIFKRDLRYLYLCVCMCLSSVRTSGYLCGCMYVLACVEASRGRQGPRAGVKDSWKGCESHDPGAEN